MVPIAEQIKESLNKVFNYDPVLMEETVVGSAEWFNNFIVTDMTNCITLQYKYVIDNFQIKRLEELIDVEVITLIQASSGIHNYISPYMEVSVYYKL